MRIEKFRVQGFKNFTQEIVMDNLRGYNVIHGVNNVGKSNLLEAMALLMCPALKPDQDSFSLTATIKEFEIRAWIPALVTDQYSGVHAFNVVPEGLRRSIKARGSEAKNQFERSILSEATNSDETFETHRDHYAQLLSASRRGPFNNDRFMLLPVSRSISGNQVRRHDGTESNLALEMYDAQQSEDIFNVKRWRTFVDAMKAFQDLTGPGEFVATYNRQSSQAQLMFESKDARVPFRLLGSGIQQIVTLLGMILMSNASIIAIEEPELNLRWALQTRLADVLKQLLDTPDAGIDQLFITTHSPAFSDTPDFWLMQKGIAGPTISRRPSEDLALVLQDSLETEPKLPKRTMEAWLTKDGIVKVPPRVQKLLHLADGGAVAFREAPNGVLIQNEDEALAIAGLGPTLELAHEG